MPKVLYNRTVVLNDDGTVLMWDAHRQQKWGEWVFTQPGVSAAVLADGVIDRLVVWVKEHGASQTEVAARCGVSQPTVSRWLRGGVTPTDEQAAQIEAMLKG